MLETNPAEPSSNTIIFNHSTIILAYLYCRPRDMESIIPTARCVRKALRISVKMGCRTICSPDIPAGVHLA